MDLCSSVFAVNTLYRLVIAFFPRSKCLLISWQQSTVHSDFGAHQVYHCFHCFPIYLPWYDGQKSMIFIFWMLSFKPAFSVPFTCIKRLCSFSLFTAIRVVLSVYLRLLIFLPEILIPALSSLAFCMMCSACKLNKQGDSKQPWCTPFPILNQSIVPCPVLTVASWPAYRFHRRQVRWSGIPVSLRIFHRLLWSTQSKALS